MENISSSKILLRGAIYGSIIGSVITAGVSSLSTSALTAADGVFGQYFINIVTSACGTADGVVTSFDTASDNFGAKVCRSFNSMLGDNNIYVNAAGNIGINNPTPSTSLALDVSGSIMARGTTSDIDANRNIWAQAFYDRNNGSYYVDPNGTSNVNTVKANTLSGSIICLGGDCKTAWPGGSNTTLVNQIGLNTSIWPAWIRCTRGSEKYIVPIAFNNGTRVQYTNRLWAIIFNIDGTYNSDTNGGGFDCSSKSISYICNTLNQCIF